MSQAPANVTVGQEVYIAKPGSWETSYTLAKVARVLAAQVVVEVPTLGGTLERRFSLKSGYEVGKADAYRAPYLNWDVATLKDSLAAKARRRACADKIDQAGRAIRDPKDTWGEDTLRTAIERARKLLAEAEAALEG